MTEKEVLEHLHTLLVEHFEVEPELIRPQARLYEDLGIDSIDAVDMVVQLRDLTGIRVPADEFKRVTTLQDVTKMIGQIVNEQQEA